MVTGVAACPQAAKSLLLILKGKGLGGEKKKKEKKKKDQYLTQAIIKSSVCELQGA